MVATAARTVDARTDTLDSRVPDGPIEQKWDRCIRDMKLVNPANKRKFEVVVVGTGLAGGSAAASLAELGYHVKSFCIQDSPRRAHSIAAQGGINAAKNYQNDGDSVWRLFYDTVKGGDYRSREANVYRLAQISNKIIDHCAALGVPFAREYGGALANRSFGGAQVSRTFYARGQTGQQLLLGAYSAMNRQVYAGRVKVYAKREMLDLIVVDGVARGIVTRNLNTGRFETHLGDAVVLATGGYGNVYYLSTNAKSCNVTAAWRCHKRGAYYANPCFTQIHPTCIPASGDYQSKLTLMSESLRNDGRVWVPKKKGDARAPEQIPDGERDYYLERRYPAFGNLVPRDVASRAAKERCDSRVRRRQDRGTPCSSTSVTPSAATGGKRSPGSTGTCSRCTRRSPTRTRTRPRCGSTPPSTTRWAGCGWTISCKSTIPGLFVLGEANFSDHGANRLGASALMQGLADGYFVIPYTIGDHLARMKRTEISEDHPACKEALVESRNRIEGLLAVNGTRSPNTFHKELGAIMWEHVGMERSAEGLETALGKIRGLRDEFWQDVKVSGKNGSFNQSLEHAGRVADFLEFAETQTLDALARDESCGGHFRMDHQTPEGEAKRDDENFSHVTAWEYAGEGEAPVEHREPLKFKEVSLSTRSPTSRPPP